MRLIYVLKKTSGGTVTKPMVENTFMPLSVIVCSTECFVAEITKPTPQDMFLEFLLSK